ncbi:hypothetical protein PCH_Pc19g00010 [Penicillium rubens Wisconsin 54-1255]|uniref:Uncharacterized protein n=1 Tax=Penicillium rubens (strain ATCC 28089 / DSM 1075 / NRRL 1951 / Wisconsin 54-1255) TaxID=500485 RepID=B6HD00_PENRW|nr:hypothetical protein PCH_Pc19g00010 [Penicillium rubens Wisconsin 54-1255]
MQRSSAENLLTQRSPAGLTCHHSVPLRSSLGNAAPPCEVVLFSQHPPARHIDDADLSCEAPFYTRGARGSEGAQVLHHWARGSDSRGHGSSEVLVDNAEPILRDTVVDAEPILRDTVANAEPILRDTVVDAEPILRDTVDDAEPILRDTVDNAEPILRDTVDNAEPILRDTVDIAEPILRSTFLHTQGSLAVRERKSYIAGLVAATAVVTETLKPAGKRGTP